MKAKELLEKIYIVSKNDAKVAVLLAVAAQVGAMFFCGNIDLCRIR